MMKTITVDLNTFEHEELHIGRVGENLHVQFVIDVSEYVDGMNSPSVAMTIENANGLRYPGTAFLDGTNVVWTIIGGDLVADGVGYAQLTIMDGEEIVKSATATTRVEPSLTADGETPDPIQDFVEHAGEAIDTILGVESRVTQLTIEAEVAKYGAETAKTAAEDAQRSAEAARNSADFASREAMAAKGEAEAAQARAEAARSGSETAQGLAETAQGLAEAAQSGAEAAQAGAEAAQTAAEAAQAAAEAAQAGAEAAVQTAIGELIDDTSTASDHVWSAQKVSTVTGGKMDANLKGASGGVAELDESGKVPSSQLPSYVDDVVEYATRSAFPGTGESGKIYVALDTNTTYRWTGATYAAIGNSIALGETESTAYRGDRGKAAYDAAVANPDAAPTEGSNDLVKSGGVYTALTRKANVHNPYFTGFMSLGRKEATGAMAGSIALGSNVEASGEASFAQGSNTKAAGTADHAEGYLTETAGGGMYGNHAEGFMTKATGGGAHAENNQTTASGNSSHAEGILTTASGQAAHAEGLQTTASKASSHAEGQGTTASGEESHSEGLNTTASGTYSHAEGSNATASAQGSHAEGIGTSASGLASHAEGTGVEATGVSSHAGGKYNIPDSIDDYPLWVSGTHYYVGDIVRKDTSSTYPYRCITENSDTTYTSSKWTPHQYLKHAEVIGNGTSNNARSNARTLTWDGTEEVAGDVKANACGGANPVSLVETAQSVAGKYTKPVGGIPASDIAEGVIPDPEDLIDDTAGTGDTGKVWSADKLSQLNSALNDKPQIMDSDAENVDLDISDLNGNVILRLADGHIKTKNFDSSNIDVGGSPTISESDATGVDLDVSDKYGKVLARFKDGHFSTKEFDSSEIKATVTSLDKTVKIMSDGYEEFISKITYNASTTNTIKIEEAFKKGETIWFHLEDGLKYWDYGGYASYYEGNTQFANNRRGSNGYFRHVVNADCDSVKITIGTNEYTNGTELTLHVYRITGEIKPTIVTVKADGTGMFQTIRAAVDSITDANHLTKPYVIEVYPGTYDTLDGYSDAEIQAAGDVEHYTQTSMVGVKLTDGMSMRGIGDPDEIVLTADLDPDDWDFSVRGEISTLNLQGEGSLENMTIIGKNIRYCIHDDFRAPVNSLDKRVLRNLIFKGARLSYYPFMTTFGGGMSQPRDYLIENCDFGYDLGIHSNSGYTYGCTIIVNNCSGCRFRIGDVASAAGDAENHIIVNNCNFQVIKTTHDNTALSSHMILTGTGCEQSMIKDTATTPGLYRLGMIDLFPTGLTTGSLVKRASSGLGIEATSDPAVAIGIVIGSDTDYSYIQRTGYIASNYLGLTGLAVGDYVTVDGSTHLVVTGGTAANAVGVVKSVDSDGVAYIKMMI